MKHEVMNMNFDVSSFTQQLPPPNNIHVLQTRVKNEVVITWDKLHLALVDVKYHVYRGTANNGVFYRITKEPISDNSFIDVQEKHPALYNQYWDNVHLPISLYINRKSHRYFLIAINFFHLSF